VRVWWGQISELIRETGLNYVYGLFIQISGLHLGEYGYMGIPQGVSAWLRFTIYPAGVLVYLSFTRTKA
jgi:hypothetical protein